MVGLRAKQKANRSGRILEAASRLFREAGYSAVRIEDIAQAAEVSAGTCYNYFDTKGDLLLAIVSMEVEEVVEAGALVVANLPADVATALESLMGLYFDHSLHYLSKEMWRTAMAFSIEAPQSPFSVRYTDLDGMLARQVCDLIRAMQQRGYARTDVDANAVAQMIFNDLNQMFTEFVKREDMTLADLHIAANRQSAAMARLLSPSR